MVKRVCAGGLRRVRGFILGFFVVTCHVLFCVVGFIIPNVGGVGGFFSLLMFLLFG